MTALRKTAEMYATKYLDVMNVVSRDSYVDDIVHICGNIPEAKKTNERHRSSLR